MLDERYIGIYVIGRKQVVEVGSSRVRNRDESEWVRIPDHHLLPAVNVRSRNEFVTKALKFYCGYLNSGKAEDYLLQSLSSVLTSTVQDTENRLARMDFKIAVTLLEKLGVL